VKLTSSSQLEDQAIDI